MIRFRNQVIAYTETAEYPFKDIVCRDGPGDLADAVQRLPHFNGKEFGRPVLGQQLLSPLKGFRSAVKGSLMADVRYNNPLTPLSPSMDIGIEDRFFRSSMPIPVTVETCR